MTYVYIKDDMKHFCHSHIQLSIIPSVVGKLHFNLGCHFLQHITQVYPVCSQSFFNGQYAGVRFSKESTNVHRHGSAVT